MPHHTTTPQNETKICSKCGENKPLSAFSKHARNKDGLQYHCKECVKEQKRSSATYIPTIKRWIERNPEKHNAWTRRWNAANRGRMQVHVCNSAAKKRGALGRISPEEWIGLCDRYHERCLCCGEVRPLSIDHIVPLSKGGSNTLANVQPLCGKCNSSKRDKVIDYRMPEVGSGY